MTPKTIPEKQSGLTLIELVIGLSIMAVVLSGAFMLMSSSLAAWQSGKARVEVEQNLRVGIDTIVRDARYAVSANVTQDSDGILVLTFINNDEDTLDFKLNPVTKALTKRITTKGGTTGNFQPIAGDGTGTTEGNVIIVDNPDTGNAADKAMFSFSPQDKLVSVTITAMDKKTGVRATMQTKIFCMNI